MRYNRLHIRFFIISILGSLLILASCNKEGAGCFDKAGEIRTVTVDLPVFTSIDVTTNVDVQLLNSGIDRVEITAGENLLSGIKFKVEDGVLKIENLNSCFWSRGYVSPLVSIRNESLSRVVQHGYGKIYSKDTLSFGEFSIQVEDASGAVDLIVDASYIRVVSNNIGPITLRGNSARLDVGIYWSDGILYVNELIVKDCNVNHNGSNRIEVNVLNNLKGSINSIGSVYLFGQKPTIIDVELTDEGSIIKKY